MILAFCEDIGVSRKGNENFTGYKKLEFFAREELNAGAPRTFAVLDPVLLQITNYDEVTEKEVEACIFPPHKEKGVRMLKITPNMLIDRSDFSETVVKGFFGVMPGQVVCLRYGPFVVMEEVVKDVSGKVIAVKVKAMPGYKEKVKGVI